MVITNLMPLVVWAMVSLSLAHLFMLLESPTRNEMLFFLFQYFYLHTNSSSPTLLYPAHNFPIPHNHALLRGCKDFRSLTYYVEAGTGSFPLNQGRLRYPAIGNGLQETSSCTQDMFWSHFQVLHKQIKPHNCFPHQRD